MLNYQNNKSSTATNNQPANELLWPVTDSGHRWYSATTSQAWQATMRLAAGMWTGYLTAAAGLSTGYIWQLQQACQQDISDSCSRPVNRIPLTAAAGPWTGYLWQLLSPIKWTIFSFTSKRKFLADSSNSKRNSYFLTRLWASSNMIMFPWSSMPWAFRDWKIVIYTPHQNSSQLEGHFRLLQNTKKHSIPIFKWINRL